MALGKCIHWWRPSKLVDNIEVMNMETSEIKINHHDTKKRHLETKIPLTSEGLKLLVDVKEVLCLELPWFVFASFEFTLEFVNFFG